MNKQQRPEWAESWFKTVVKKSNFSVRPISLSASKEWQNNWGAIQHKSGLFFKIVGVSWKDLIGEVHERPLVEQREIGTLGFLMYKGKKCNEILVQAKIEPGNVGICQIGPTYQATASNAARVHGGKTPAFKELFSPDGQQIVFQALQSEQGSRFLGKLNRNTVVVATKKVSPKNLHKWVTTEELLQCLDMDHFINTDSRSVLVCTPWKELVSRQPFSKESSPLAKELENSYLLVDSKTIEDVKKDLEQHRAEIQEPKIIALGKLKNWKVTSFGVRGSQEEPYDIRQVLVTAQGREVGQWDQPIVQSKTKGRAVLFCRNIRGVLRFNFNVQAEAGLVHKAELSPSIVTEPGSKRTNKPPSNHQVLAEVNQSDEGGRFLRDVSKYEIVFLPDGKSVVRTQGYWLTLGEVHELLQSEGIFTNESRSVLSLLLKWL